jgi:hypothetical protein
MTSSVLAGLVMVASAALISDRCLAEVHIVVPVHISGLDAGTRFIGFGCEVWDADNRLVGNGGLPFIAIATASLDTTLTIPVRRTEASAGAASRYTCLATIYGRRADGIPYNFMTTNGRLSLESSTRRTAWYGSSWEWPGDAIDATRTVFILSRAGTRMQLRMMGTIPPLIAAGMAAVEIRSAGDCPCGCGAGGADGAACRMRSFAGYNLPDARASSRVPTPQPRQPPVRESQATITPESRRLGLDRRTRGPIPGSGTFTPFVTAALVEFSGDGRLTLAK